LPEGARATLSVRPERIGVARAGEGIAGRVEDFVFRGEYSLLRVRVTPDVVLRVGAYEGRFAIGEEVRLTIAPDAGVLFAEGA
jgi:putrescine transport system ATP-binding protein